LYLRRDDEEQMAEEVVGFERCLVGLRERLEDTEASLRRGELRRVAVSNGIQSELVSSASEIRKVVAALQSTPHITAEARDAYQVIEGWLENCARSSISPDASDSQELLAAKRQRLLRHCDAIVSVAKGRTGVEGTLNDDTLTGTLPRLGGVSGRAKEQLDVTVRWIVRNDVMEVLAIDNETYTNPLTEDDLIAALRQRNVVGNVVEVDDQIVGFIVFALHRDSLQIVRFAVDPDYARRGVGQSVLEQVMGKIGRPGSTRHKIEAWVPEDAISAQLFFRANQFWATGECANGHYRMVYPRPAPIW
jgi:ribosomal-protein-alanine N-acetyltransferase